MSAKGFVFLIVFMYKSTVDGLFAQASFRFQFTSTDSQGCVYLEQYSVNKVLIVKYDSSLGNYTGYTHDTIALVTAFNKDKHFLEKKKHQIELFRVGILQTFQSILNAKVKPYAWLRSATPPGTGHTSTLVCSVFNFYPKQIRLTWLLNGQEVTSNVTSTEELANGKWLFQIHSHLVYTPSYWDQISCKVEHESLAEPQLYTWEPVSAAEKKKLAVGSAGLLLGVVLITAGAIYYRRTSTRRELVPSREDVIGS